MNAHLISKPHYCLSYYRLSTRISNDLGMMYRFASIAKIAGEQLEPYIKQLVPKLYRSYIIPY